MKLNLQLILLAACQLGGDAFSPASSFQSTYVTSTQTTKTTTALNNFLDGGVKKNDIMQREDEAMWIDENDTGGGWNPFASKKKAPPPPVAKKAAPVAQKKAAAAPSFFGKKKSTPPPTPPEPKASGFKFPWDK